MWIYGSGFPKGKNLGREVEAWKGWSTALKPAHEPIVVARKPLAGTVVGNVREHSTGAMNIDGCRIEGRKSIPTTPSRAPQGVVYGDLSKDPGTGSGWDPDVGRWPANVVHDGSEEVLAAFPDVAGAQGDISGQEPSRPAKNVYGEYKGRREFVKRKDIDKSAARFFYCAKASRADRTERGAVGNRHPTAKPTDLMRYLCRLVTPPGGTVLDPFAGSGSTGKAAVLEGFDFVGIEKEAEYMEIARARLEHAGGVEAGFVSDSSGFDIDADLSLDSFDLDMDLSV